MTLIVDELLNGIVFEQPFRIKKSIFIAHIRPWIYKQGLIESGTLTLEVLQGERILAKSEINFNEINSNIPSTYAHGQLRFDFNSLQLNHNTNVEWTEYKLKIYMNEYVNGDNFIGLVRRYENLFYLAYGDVDSAGHGGGPDSPGKPVNDMISPLGYELFKFDYQR